ncbi:DNA polymerase III subunit alpha [Pseudoxanthomonas spadix BD-a59]|uniref:DNA polymerase III subunit alpha n=1 Tax=Pseudoxanthomonas spadix (strain BD-a59) TaxID=1045855 RepID=G7UPI7_PSEUP|nr:DNA polymerase III subunit alpha [Pseudoxanthomonas spadix]AER56800.1 DNA polymerase III subunit alpha [Pseudoxanthomonas spadix BD-a59]
MSSRFIHLHLHTEFSLADSTIRVPEKPDEGFPAKAKRPNLVSAAVQLQLPALAVTDRNNLFALVKYYKACEAVGIKPIAGADVSIVEEDGTPWSITLLCRDHSGYLTLSRLLTRAWLEGHRSDGVAIDPAWLREDTTGLFGLIGRNSQAGRLAGGGRHELAEQHLAGWQRAFGENLHLELTRTGREGEDAFNAFALHAAAARGLPVVASNDVRFLEASGFDAHEARVCISSGRVLDDPKRPREYSPEQFLKSAAQMSALFADVPDAIDNTWALAQRCNLELKLGTYFLPAYPVPADQTLDSWIRSQARHGLEARLEKNPLAPGKTRQDYLDRLEFELDTIIKMGFPGYFLIVADFIQWGKQQGIPIGPGRGSGAGSLVAWALQITDLDPLPYNLLFERFLNPERVSMPDFDIDFCMDRRDEVIDYVARKYGRDRVSQIITYGTMAAKAVVRDVGRVLGFPYGFVDGVAKLIPNVLGITLKDALGEGKDESMHSSELSQRYREQDDVRDLIELARQLEDLTRNAGKHAGGVVIAPSPLSDFCPLFAEHDEGTRGRNPVTQFDKDDVEAVGLVKFDFLGLRTLTIIDWAVKAINGRDSGPGTRDPEKPSGGNPAAVPTANTWRDARDSGPGTRDPAAPSGGNPAAVPTPNTLRVETAAAFAECHDLAIASPGSRVPSPESRPLLDIAAIPLDDQATYRDIFAAGNTGAVFQFESAGMRRLLKDARPDRFEDLIALVSLYRPGPMDLIPDFNARKHGQQQIIYPDPRTETILKDTYGIMVYQEQVMQMAQIVGGYSLGGADLLRRAMGKKVPAEMAKHREIFRTGAAAGGVSAAKADEIFDLMEKFAGYGFNKSHAAAYALVSYQTAWLKRHYPAEFLAATLSSDMDNTDKVVGFLGEARVMELEILPPKVNHSDYMFVATDARTVRYGLGAIKGVGQGACEAIVAERARGGAFTDLLDFCKRVGSARLNRRTLEAMVNAGALDELGRNRASLMLQLPEVIKVTEQLARERASGQSSLFGGGDSGPALEVELPEVDEWPLAHKLNGERETLGHYLSGHPMDPYRDDLKALVGNDLGSLETIVNAQFSGGEKKGWRPGVTAVLAGKVVAVRQKGDSQSFVTLEDGRGRVECSAFSDAMGDFGHLLTRDRILVVKGELREDEFNGGYALRLRQCWDYAQLVQQAQKLSMRLDLRVPGVLARIESLLAERRPGSTSLRLDLLLPEGVAGTLEINGSQSVRVDAELVGTLRELPGVCAVKMAMGQRPWTH